MLESFKLKPFILLNLSLFKPTSIHLSEHVKQTCPKEHFICMLERKKTNLKVNR